MNMLTPPERYFAAILALHTTPPECVDLPSIARDWPRPFALRLFASLPTACAVTSLLALPNRLETARVGQLLRDAALDKATDDAVSKSLSALAEINYPRAATLRRDMEWEARDAAFFPSDLLPHAGADLPLHLALLADDLWNDLLLPCYYRLPAPKDYPDVWPETSDAILSPNLPEFITDIPIQRLRAGIEWLHLWRLDPALAEAVWQSVPIGQAESWISALLESTRPESTERLPYDLVVLEHVLEDRESFLSQLEVEALLRGVCDESEDDSSRLYTEEARQTIRGAVQVWLERAGRG